MSQAQMNPFLHPIRNLAAKVHQKPQTTKYLFNFFSFPLKITVAEPVEAHPHTVPERSLSLVEGPVEGHPHTVAELAEALPKGLPITFLLSYIYYCLVSRQ